MSDTNKQLKDMFDKAWSDPGFKKLLLEDEKSKAVLMAALTRWGKSSGELSDDDLDMVAGGGKRSR